MFEHGGALGASGGETQGARPHKKHQRNNQEEEVEKLVELFSENKDDENPTPRIHRQWKARGLSKWSNNKIVDKIYMKIELVDDRAKLGKVSLNIFFFLNIFKFYSSGFSKLFQHTSNIKLFCHFFHNLFQKHIDFDINSAILKQYSLEVLI